MAALAGFFIVILILVLIVYVYTALALMALAKKTNTPNGWLAWIPIANIFLMVNISKQPWWWALVILLVPLVPFIGQIAAIAATIFIWWKIAEAIQKPGWWGLLMLIPIVNLVMLGIMAWGN